jgi:uncharacterized protein with PIN domain
MDKEGLSLIMAASAISDSNLTPEQRAVREVKRRASEHLEKQRKVHTMIRQSTCPICNGKLNRGKKDKNNNYKRTWNCTNCESVYTI